jgi:hypothetical protein
MRVTAYVKKEFSLSSIPRDDFSGFLKDSGMTYVISGYDVPSHQEFWILKANGEVDLKDFNARLSKKYPFFDRAEMDLGK